MHHPGSYISLLYLAILYGSVLLVGDLKNNRNEAGAYVCPPCGCSRHADVWDAPGRCRGCGMPLISLERKRSQALEAIFESPSTTFYHHKLFYPVNFLALFIGIFALYRSRNDLVAVLFLVFFMSLMLYSFKNQLYGTDYSMHASKKWAFFPVSFLLAAGPALYLYIAKILKPGGGFSRGDGLHFLPAGLVFLLHAACFLGPEAWRQRAIYNNYDHFPGLAEQLAFLLSGVFYSYLIGKTVRAGGRMEPPWLQWQRQLRIFFAAVLVTLAAMLAGNFFYFDLMSTWLDYHPVWLLIAVFTLWSAFFLVFKNEVVCPKAMAKENRLPDAKITAWKIALETAMQTHKPYLDPDLSLQALAQLIGIKEKDLSEVLNIGFSQSFHDYINRYRIETVKRLLLAPEKQHLTNFALAQEAGFNSRSAFFGLFKKYVGMTPGEFKRNRML